MDSKEKTNNTKIKGSALLSEAIQNAEILLSYASEKGLEIPHEIIKTTTSAKQLEQNENWDIDTETFFWESYQQLASLVAPVSIDSLKAYQKPLKTDRWSVRKFLNFSPHSKANRSVLNYAMMGLFTVLVMLVIQIYSIKGTTLLNTIDINTERMTVIEDRLTELIMITENPNNRSALMEQNQLELENEKLAKEIESSTELLNSWLQTSNFFRTTYPGSIKSDVIEKAQIQNGPPSFEASINKNIMVIQEAHNFIFVLNLYILPILYGLLGAFIFVIRVLMTEYKEMTFTPSSNIKHMLRIFTGALGGLIVGIFWGDIETLQIGLISSLQPLAVAFLVGYSVEFLFQIIDTLISKVTPKKAGQKN